MTEEELVEKFESENITLSPLSKRAAAYVLDEVVVTILIFFAFSDAISAAGTEQESMRLVMERLLPYIILLKIAYHAFFVYAYGATLGKKALKIRVISIHNAANPNFVTALTRSLVRVISETFFYIGFLWVFRDYKKQAWQDLSAKTLVVNA
jgi:uncharacterized RDD family membrane protein YckC